MKHKLLPKFFLIGLVAFSLFSFIFVNVHSAYSSHAAQKEELKITRPVVAEDEEDQKEIKSPDIAVIARVVDIIQKFASANR